MNLTFTASIETEIVEAAVESLMTLSAVIGVLRMFVSVSLLVAATALSAGAQNPGASAASHSWNDNALIEMQKGGGDPARPGDVKLEFYGHDAFKITSPAGLTLLVDPWSNDPTGAYPTWFLNPFPPLRVDIVLSTHAHFDHDAVEAPDSLMVLDRLAGQFKLGDFEITGLADKHQCQSAPADSASAGSHSDSCPPNNVKSLDNTIQIIATGGLRIAVWGDNRAVPSASLDFYLRNIDVLILPVDNVLSRPEVDAITRKYDPKAVIPAHYFIEGLTSSAAGLESADGWVSDQEKTHRADVRRLNRADLTLNPADLKGSRNRIYYFGSHFETR